MTSNHHNFLPIQTYNINIFIGLSELLAITGNMEYIHKEAFA